MSAVVEFRKTLETFCAELLAAADRQGDVSAIAGQMLYKFGFPRYFDANDLLIPENVKADLAELVPTLAPSSPPLPSADNFYGAGSQAELDKLDPIERARRVDLANHQRSVAEKRVEDQKRNAIAAQNLPPDYSTWRPERKLDHFYQQQAKAKAKRGAS